MTMCMPFSHLEVPVCVCVCLYSLFVVLQYVALYCISTKLIGCSFMQTWAWVESWSQAALGQPVRGPATPLMGEYDTAHLPTPTKPTKHTHTHTSPKHSEIIMRSIICCSPLSVTQWLHLSFPINAALFVISFIPVYVSCYWFWPEVLSPSVNVWIHLLM